MPLIPLSLAILSAALSWLLPVHRHPWPAFQQDLAAALALFFVYLGIWPRRATWNSWPASAWVLIAVACVPLVQRTIGTVFFGGDAVLVALYLTGAALAVVAGYALSAQPDMREQTADMLWGVITAAAIASCAIALGQWLELSVFAEYETLMSGRPGANLAQPNQLATLLVLGVIGLLHLHERKRTSQLGLIFALPLMLFVLALTQSRAAWLEMALLVMWLVVSRRRTASRVNARGAIAIGGLFAVCVLALPSIFSALLLANPRGGTGGGSQTEAGTRPTHWASMVDAIERQPWTGYGWNQVSVAQSRVAADHPMTGEMIEHSHNFVLDMLVWNGVPLGLLLLGLIAYWFVRKARSVRQPTDALLLVGIAAVFMHALVEFPLDYAYFLLPVAFMAGLLERHDAVGPIRTAPRNMTLVLALAAVGMTTWVAAEYLPAESNLETFRFESAHIGTPVIRSQVPDLILLTQVREFLKFARAQAHRGMTPEQVDWMRRVADRYGYPPVVFRYALALALNGHPRESQAQLVRVCKILPVQPNHPNEDNCADARENWNLLSQQYSEVRAVPFPAPEKPVNRP